MAVNTAIVAALCSRTGAIGHNNQLPWKDRLDIDMAFFRFITTVPWTVTENNVCGRTVCRPIPMPVIADADSTWIKYIDPAYPYAPSKFKLDFKVFEGDQSKPPNAIVMGRRTAQSMPVPLPLKNRTNVVLTRKQDMAENNINLANTNESDPKTIGSRLWKADGLFYANDCSIVLRQLPLIIPTSNLLVIGGSAIYSECLHSGLVDHLFLTFVTLNSSSDLKGTDILFPHIPQSYRLVENISHLVACALLEWSGTSATTKQLLKEQIDGGETQKTGSIKEKTGHVLRFLWFQKELE